MSTNVSMELVMNPVISKQEFLKKYIQILKNQHFQKGAIESMDPANLKLKYIWGYQYKGKVDGNWACQLIGEHTVEYGEKKSKFANGTPVISNFNDVNFNVLVPYIGQDNPYFTNEFIGVSIDLHDVNLIPYDDSKISEDDIINELKEEASNYWLKYGNIISDNVGLNYVQTLAENDAYIYSLLGAVPPTAVLASANASKKVCGFSRGLIVDNWSIKTRNTLNAYGDKVLIPIYVLDYKFNNDNYFLVGFADKKGKGRATVPLTLKKTPEDQVNEEFADKFKIIKLLKWGWILAIPVLFIVGFIGAVVYIIAWLLYSWFLKRTVNKRLEELRRSDEREAEENEKLLAARWGIDL